MDEILIRGAQRARTWLRERGFPYDDDISLKPSGRTFPDGGHFAVETPVVNNLQIMEAMVRLLESTGLKAIMGETHGASLLTDSEVKDMLELCFERRFGMFFSIGTRPAHDRKSAFYRTDSGLSQGRRLNNNDALAYSVDEVFRLTELGCRGIIVYDLGLLRVFNEMRKQGAIPSDVMFAASTHCIISNPVTAQIYAENGADQLVVLHDLGLAVIQEMRRMLPDSVALSVPIDSYASKGGFIRYYEIAEIAQVASPMFLKLGSSAQTDPGELPDEDILKRRMDRMLLGLEYLNKTGLQLEELPQNSPYRCIPEVTR